MAYYCNESLVCREEVGYVKNFVMTSVSYYQNILSVKRLQGYFNFFASYENWTLDFQQSMPHHFTVQPVLSGVQDYLSVNTSTHSRSNKVQVSHVPSEKYYDLKYI